MWWLFKGNSDPAYELDGIAEVVIMWRHARRHGVRMKDWLEFTERRAVDLRAAAPTGKQPRKPARLSRSAPMVRRKEDPDAGTNRTHRRPER